MEIRPTDLTSIKSTAEHTIARNTDTSSAQKTSAQKSSEDSRVEFMAKGGMQLGENDVIKSQKEVKEGGIFGFFAKTYIDTEVRNANDINTTVYRQDKKGTLLSSQKYYVLEEAQESTQYNKDGSIKEKTITLNNSDTKLVQTDGLNTVIVPDKTGKGVTAYMQDDSGNIVKKTFQSESKALKAAGNLAFSFTSFGNKENFDEVMGILDDAMSKQTKIPADVEKLFKLAD